MSLRIIATGGTFDKHYDPLSGSLSFDQTHLTPMLRNARVLEPFSLQVLMLMDSLDMTAAHRTQILDACHVSPEQSIVIIHGTDTMAQTAQVLAQAGLGSTIVLTGSMVPAEIVDSDASFNLGFAVAAARLSAPGVYIAMNGRLLAGDTAQKNRSLGIFESGAR